MLLGTDQEDRQQIFEPLGGSRRTCERFSHFVGARRVPGVIVLLRPQSHSERDQAALLGRLLERGHALGDVVFLGNLRYGLFKALDVGAIKRAEVADTASGQRGTKKVRHHELLGAKGLPQVSHHRVVAVHHGRFLFPADLAFKISGREHLDVAIKEHAIDRRVCADLPRIGHPPVAYGGVGEVVGGRLLADQFVIPGGIDEKRAGHAGQSLVGVVAAVVHDHVAVVEHLGRRVDRLDGPSGCERAFLSGTVVLGPSGLFERHERERGEIADLVFGKRRVFADVHVAWHVVP